MRHWRNTILFVLALMLALPAAWASAGPPTETVKHAIGEVLDTLKNPAYEGAGKSRRRQVVFGIVNSRFDFEEMAKRSLGTTWNTLNRSQREEFTRLFADLLVESYADKVEKYIKHVGLEYTGEMVEGNFAEVKTVVIRPNDRIPLNYRLLQEPGGWKIYDVIIEGVSLINNYRSQFNRIIREKSYGELVSRLRTKVRELKETQNM